MSIDKQQRAGINVEERMIEVFLSRSDTEDLTVATIKNLAFFARQIAFDEFVNKLKESD